MSFRIRGLAAEPFQHLFALPDAALASRGAVRRVADVNSPYPCRISLTDAAPGDEVLLVNYEHHAVASPYRAAYAIYVRANERTYDARDEVPAQLRTRLLALRAYDAGAMLIAYDLFEGDQLEAGIERMLANPRAAYLHAHFARAGCYAARVDRD